MNDYSPLRAKSDAAAYSTSSNGDAERVVGGVGGVGVTTNECRATQTSPRFWAERVTTIMYLCNIEVKPN